MKIIDSRWTKVVNMLKIRCGCGNEFEVRSDRWIVKCQKCNATQNIESIRQKFVRDGGF